MHLNKSLTLCFDILTYKTGMNHYLITVCLFDYDIIRTVAIIDWLRPI